MAINGKKKKDDCCCGKTVTETNTTVTEYGTSGCHMPKGTLQYIGARYVPVFADPVEWSADRPYEHLMMVQHEGNTYISKQAVPVGVPLPTDTGDNEYWVLLSNFSAQIEQYREEVHELAEDVSSFNDDLQQVLNDVEDMEKSVAKKGVARTMMIAHRGLQRSAPENTLEGMSLAAQYGYTHVEFDVWKTADDVWVCFHDATLNRMTNGTGNVYDYTYNQLMNYPITKGSFNSLYSNPIYIPTLDAMLRHIKKLGLNPIVEIKNSTGETTLYTQDDINEILSIIEGNRLTENCAVISYEREYIKMVTEANPMIYTLVVQKSSNGWNYNDLKWIVEYCGANGMMLNGSDMGAGNLTQALVDQFHADGFDVAAFGAYSSANISTGGGQKQLALGLDAVVTNDAADMVYQGNNSVATNQTFAYREKFKGVQCINGHEVDCLTQGMGGFNNTYLWRENEEGFFTTNKTMHRVATYPVKMEPGTVIEIDDNPRYQYSVMASDETLANTVTSGWQYGGKFVVPMVNNTTGTNPNPDENAIVPYVSIMVCGRDNDTFVLAERDLEMAFAGVKVNGKCMFEFATAAGGSYNYMLKSPSYRRMITRAMPCGNGTVVPINEVADGVRYAIDTYKSDGSHSSTSGWLTAETDYTINDANAAYFVMIGSNSSGGQLTPVEAYNISKIPAFNAR